MEPGDEDELYQDGVLILYETAKKFDPQTLDFHKMFKTELAHRFIDYVRLQKAQCRNVHKKTALFHSDPSQDSLSSNEGIDTGVLKFWCENFRHDLESRDAVKKFLEILTDEDRLLLAELLEPSDQTVYIFSNRVYQRVPKSIPLKVIGRSLGWTEKKVKYRLRQIRRSYVIFFGRYDLTPLISRV